MNIINNNKEKHKMLRIRAIILGVLTVAVSMAAEASEAVQVATVTIPRKKALILNIL